MSMAGNDVCVCVYVSVSLCDNVVVILSVRERETYRHVKIHVTTWSSPLGGPHSLGFEVSRSNAVESYRTAHTTDTAITHDEGDTRATCDSPRTAI